MAQSRRSLLLLLFLFTIPALSQTNPNLHLGNPSHATTDVNSPDNYLLIKKEYVLSYNNSRGAANWVSWTLKKSDIGKVPRADKFHVETALPESFNRVAPEDYSKTGFDQGHLCNSKDRTRTAKANLTTFGMANMQPQTPDLNRGVWKKLEEDSRKLALKGNTLYILAGCYGNNGKIGKTHTVIVPASCWKLAVVEGPNPSVIVVDIPNKKGIAKNTWQKYATTMEDVENKTGFHLTSVVQD